MQLGQVPTSVVFGKSIGKQEEQALLYYCLSFFCWKLGGMGQLLEGEITGHLSKAWNCHFSLWDQGEGSTPEEI